MFKCNFRNTEMCKENNSICDNCAYLNVILPMVEVSSNMLEDRVHYNNLLERKVKNDIDAAKRGCRVNHNTSLKSPNSLLSRILNLGKDDEISVNFFINGNYKMSSEGLELYTIDDFINYLPDELSSGVVKEYSVVGNKRVFNVEVNC